MTARFVRISKFCEETGYSKKAVESKIYRGDWLEGRHFRRAPDRSIMMDMEGYERWVENQPAVAYEQRATA